MFSSLEKTFDAAFFNAKNSLKRIVQFIANIEDSILAEDIYNGLEQSINNVDDQLSILAFCFAQLMCKTILFSENCFIFKETLKQLQMENFHLKSDKEFMEFSRKIDQVFSSNGSRFQSKSDNNNNKKASQHKPSFKNHTGVVKFFRKKASKQNAQATTTNHHQSNPTIVSTRKLEDQPKSLDFQDNLIYNLECKQLKQLRFRPLPRANHNALRVVYKNFKESRIITSLRSQNLALQKENILLKCELSTNRLLIRYMNNQISGRIQQIQLLTRDRKDSNFDQVWNDLETEILLNKYKTVTQALNYNDETQQNTFMDLFQSNRSLAVIDPKALIENQTSSNGIAPSDQERKISSSSSCDASSSSPIEFRNFPKSWLKVGLFRFIMVDLDGKALGISITGGKEYGLPISIARIHDGTPAHKTNAFRPGDMILSVNLMDFTDLSHQEAADILQNLSGTCRIGVIYLTPDVQQQDPNESIDSELAEQLSMNFYRSIFNSLLMPAFGLNNLDEDGGGSSSTSSSSSYDDSVDSDDPDYESDKNENETNKVKNKPTTFANQCSLKAVPGMARLFSK